MAGWLMWGVILPLLLVVAGIITIRRRHHPPCPGPAAAPAPLHGDGVVRAAARGAPQPGASSTAVRAPVATPVPMTSWRPGRRGAAGCPLRRQCLVRGRRRVVVEKVVAQAELGQSAAQLR